MAINNRSLDASEQKKTFAFSAAATATGVTGIMVHIPFPCTLNAIQVSAFGLSGAPNLAVVNNRFIAGAGVTAMTVATGTSNVLVAFGTSGVGSSGLIVGASFVNLLPNDVLMFQTGASNAAVTGLSGHVVVTPLQDVKQFFAGLA